MGVLPKPEQVKKQRKLNSIDFAKQRLRQLGDEEGKLVRKINDLRDQYNRDVIFYAAEKQKLTEAHEAFVSSLRETK